MEKGRALTHPVNHPRVRSSTILLSCGGNIFLTDPVPQFNRWEFG
jgi:hypothetical protein